METRIMLLGYTTNPQQSMSCSVRGVAAQQRSWPLFRKALYRMDMIGWQWLRPGQAAVKIRDMRHGVTIKPRLPLHC